VCEFSQEFSFGFSFAFKLSQTKPSQALQFYHFSVHSMLLIRILVKSELYESFAI
jgi:hypothetical protein